MTENSISNEQTGLDKAAIWLSRLATPTIMPTLVFIFIFIGSYLRIMPIAYRMMVVGIVACFTCLLPALFMLALRIFDRTSSGEKDANSDKGQTRFMFASSYLVCIVLMAKLGMPWYLTAVPLASLLIMLLCYLLGIWWRVSLHMAAMGGVIGALVMFGMLLGYNPVWALAALVLLAGMLGTARIVAGEHTNLQVFGGFAIGFIIACLLLYPTSSLLLQKLLFIY